ncbi:Uncharacterised protein [Mycobacterium tuberculosis]|nr:Uncharacterised protein [Mycobacterium tuberculosis]
MPRSKARRLEAAERASGKTGKEQRSIVYSHRTAGGILAAFGAESGHDARQRTFLNECFTHAYHFLHLPDKVMRQVDQMRTQIAMRAGAGNLLLQPPHERKVRIHDPIL